MDKAERDCLMTPFAQIGNKLHLLLHTGQLLMENGADSDRTVRDMMRAAAYMGIPKDQIHQHVMYTTLMLNVNDDEHTYTEFRKCHKHGVNMTTLTAISKLTWRALEKDYTLAEYERQLQHIEQAGPVYAPWQMALGAGVACGGFCMLFGGSWLDFLMTAICAWIGFWVRRCCMIWGFHPYARIAIAAFCATMAAWSMQFVTGSIAWYPIIACTLFMVPGIPLINAIDDLLNNFIVSGMTRAMNTLLIVGAMTFGIAIAVRTGGISDFTTVGLQPSNLYFSLLAAAAIASMGFSVIFNLPRRLLPLIGLGGIIAVTTRNIFVMELGFSQAAGSFLGAAVVGLLALKVVHIVHVPNIILTIPSAIPMVPGVLLYRLLFAMLNIQTVSAEQLMVGLRSGVTAIIVIIAIAIGVTIPSIFMERFIAKRRERELERLLALRAAKAAGEQAAAVK